MLRIVRVLGLMLVVSGCGAGERRADSARGDVAATADTADTSMAGMDHSKMPGMTSADTASMAGMDHSKMPGMITADTSMPGMDHSKMGATPPTTGAGTMAGMDHSKMPGMSKTTAGRSAGSTASMAGMDHANMPGMSRGAAPSRAARNVPAMDHTNMPGMTAPSTRAPAAGAMDHSNMPGMTPSPSVTPGEMKLDRLVEALLNDPAVRQRIESDTSLKRRWDAAAKQTILPTRP